MGQRIEIQLTVDDGRALTILKELNEFFGLKKLSSVTLSSVYTIDADLTANEFETLKEILAHKGVEQISLGSLPPPQFDYALEIGFLPGVTDNVAKTTQQVIADALGKTVNVYTSTLYYFSGELSEDDVKTCVGQLSNQLIQRSHIKTNDQFFADKGMDVIIPKVMLDDNPEPVEVPLLGASDEDLVLIGKKGVLDPATGERRGPLALDLAYMKAIQSYFTDVKKRNPTDIEMESLAQTWSEHCKHTIFAARIDDLHEGLYKGYIKKATNEIREKLGKDDFCVSVFTDNSGVIEFEEGFHITDKAETHNSPSALDPFGGSITGIVGVNRDTIGVGLGALPIINGYGYCFADPRKPIELYRGKNKQNPFLQPDTIMKGVVKGVNEGGNQSGIPTTQGFVTFHDNYCGKPLVFVRTVGLLKSESLGRDLTQKQAQPGDAVVVIGGRVGKDGIHGATFSSEAMDSGSPATAVQIGDPITQKKLSDAIIKEARDKGLYSSITDNGAGGISCSVAEMARECGGCHVILDDVPLKYPGMSPWEIWISESQERMTLSVPQQNVDELLALMKRRGVEAVVIGTFTDSGKCIVEQNGKEIVNLDLSFLHDGLPDKHLKTTFTKKEYEEPALNGIALEQSLSDMIARLNICSFDFISKQYDHEVGAGSVLKPLVGEGQVNTDTSVIRPLPKSKKGVALSQAVFPRYGDIDSYHMATTAIDTSIRNLVSVGVPLKKIALMDNFCWCSSTEEERLGQLYRSVKGCYDGAVAYLAPYISGKDSMFNDFKGFDKDDKPIKISAPPTLLISSIGVVDDIDTTVSPDVKVAGDLLYVIGKTKNELGGSEFYSYLGESQDKEGYIGNTVPEVDFEENTKTYDALHMLIQKNLLASSASVHLGGLGIALVKKALAGNMGMTLDLRELQTCEGLDAVSLLYSESMGRFVVSVDPQKQEDFESFLTNAEVSYAQIGTVTDEKTIALSTEQGTASLSLPVLLKNYKETLGGY